MDARFIAALLLFTGLGAGRADTRDVDRFRKPLVPGATSSDTNNSNGAGGIPALAKLIPIEKCYDRGDFVEPMNQKWFDNYMGACRDKRTSVKAGDTIPLKGVRVEVVASNGGIVEKAE